MLVKQVMNHLNQVFLNDDGLMEFHSYGTLIASIDETKEIDNMYALENHWGRYSVTTAKHYREVLHNETRIGMIIDTLIEHKVFKNFKDFMINCEKVVYHCDTKKASIRFNNTKTIEVQVYNHH